MLRVRSLSSDAQKLTTIHRIEGRIDKKKKTLRRSLRVALNFFSLSRSESVLAFLTLSTDSTAGGGFREWEWEKNRAEDHAVCCTHTRTLHDHRRTPPWNGLTEFSFLTRATSVRSMVQIFFWLRSEKLLSLELIFLLQLCLDFRENIFKKNTSKFSKLSCNFALDIS